MRKIPSNESSARNGIFADAVATHRRRIFREILPRLKSGNKKSDSLLQVLRLQWRIRISRYYILYVYIHTVSVFVCNFEKTNIEWRQSREEDGIMFEVFIERKEVWRRHFLWVSLSNGKCVFLYGGHVIECRTTFFVYLYLSILNFICFWSNNNWYDYYTIIFIN